MVNDRRIIIDGVSYNVAITSLKRKADILDKTAKRTEDGDLHREVIGTYYNYTLGIGVFGNDEEYERLWKDITKPEAYRIVTLPHDNQTFKAYFSSAQDEVSYLTENGAHFKGFTCNLTAKEPARRPGR